MRVARRFLIVALVVLAVANAVVLGAWIYRDDLQDAGVLPAAELPTRADVLEAALPAIRPMPDGREDADTVADAGNEKIAAPEAADERAVPVTPAVADAHPKTERFACVVAGAFETRQLAVEARRRLAEHSARTRVLVESVAGEPDYLVFVAPPEEREAAKALVSELEAQGVSSYLLPSGPRAGGISVGLFRSQARALAQQTRVGSMGHDVRLATIDRKRQVYRVRAQDVSTAALVDLPHRPCAADDDNQRPADGAPVAEAPPAQ